MQVGYYLSQNWKASIYRILLFGYVLVSLLNASVLPIGPIYRMYNVVCIVGCLYIQKTRRRINRSLRRILLMIFIVSLISSICANNLSLLVYVMFIITAEKDFDKLVKTVFFGQLIGLIGLISFSLIGILPDYTYEHMGMLAHSYGFYYYASIPYYLLFLSLMYIYIRKDKLRIMEILVLFTIQMISYQIFTVRLTFLISTGALGLALVLIKFKIVNIDKKFIKNISKLIFPVICLFSIYLGVNYTTENALWSSLNTLLANRISQANYAFQNYPVTIFGQQIEMHGRASMALGLYSGKYFFIDSGYIYSVLVYGVVFTVMLFLVYSLLLVRACEKKDKQLYIWIISVLVFSFVNDALINISMNPVLLSLPYMLRISKINNKLFV